MNKVLIVTHSTDNPCIEQVSQKIRQMGGEVFRWNTDEYPTHVQLNARVTSSQPFSHELIFPNGQVLDTSTLTSIWYRRFYPGKKIDDSLESQVRKASLEESRRCSLGLLTCNDDVLVVDDYWKIRKASVKDLQLKIAQELGLSIPDTLVSNDPIAVREFFDQQNGNIITKMQTSFAVWENGIEQVVFTNRVKEEHLEQLEGLSQCPMVFQATVEKKLELRATIVGDDIFCAAIDSQKHDAMKTDWRKKGSTTLDEWFPYELPIDIKQKLIQLAKALGLQYGAVDIILTHDNEYQFLEINPCGEFFWMDINTGLPICDAIAKLLCKA